MPTNTYEIIGRFRADNILLGFTKISDAAKRLEDRAKANQRAWQNQTTAFSRFYANYSRMAGAGREISGIWQHQVHSLEKYHEAAMKVAAVQQRLYTLNLKPEENQKALKGIEDVVKNLRGMKIDEVTENFLDLHSALGSVDHALDLLGDASKYRFNMKALFGEKFSGEQVNQQILGAFKFLEQTGQMRATGAIGADGKRLFTEADKHRAQEYFDVISKITAATAGRITGTELQQLAGRGGMSLMGLTPEGLKNLVFIMQEMGGSATGTSLSSAFQKFVGGTMKQSSMKELQSLGLLDLKKVEFNKSGIPKHIQPGAIPIADLLQKDPLAFADAMAKAMKEKKGIDPNNVDQVTKELANIVGGQGKTTGNLLAKLIIMRDVVRKDAEIVSNAKGVNEQYAQSLTSIAGKTEELKAVRENFRASVGQGLLGIEGEAMKSLQPTVKALSDFFMMHPEAARMLGILLLTGKALSGIAQTAAILRISGLVGGAGGGVFGQTATQAQQAAQKVAFYKRSMTGIPAAIGTTIVLTLATEVIAYILKLKGEAEQAWEDAKGTAAGNKKGIDKVYANKDITPEQTKRHVDAQMPAMIRGFVETFQEKNRTIGDWLTDYTPSFWMNGLRSVPSLQSDPRQLAIDMKQYMPELSTPSVFASFAKQLERSQMPQADKQALMNAAIQAFPKAFEEYSAALQKAQGDKVVAEQALIEQDKRTASALGEAEKAASNFANRVNNLNLTPGVQGEQGGETNPDGTPKVKMARGGIVTRPVHALIGERGPEAVIPLHRMSAFASAKPSTPVSIHYAPVIQAAGGTDTRALETILRDHATELVGLVQKGLDEHYRDRQQAV